MVRYTQRNSFRHIFGDASQRKYYDSQVPWRVAVQTASHPTTD
jgi:hypothetical protein